MNKAIILAACGLVAVAAAPSAFAQKEAMGMFYEMQMAPKVCNWSGAPSSAKLDATIKTQEQAFSITDADRAALMKTAETDIKSDPSNCAPDGILRSMYNEAVK